MTLDKTLDKLDLNSSAIIVNIDCDKSLKRRFLDLGLINGTTISAILVSPLGDPTAYEFRGNIIAIRNDEAKNIHIK